MGKFLAMDESGNTQKICAFCLVSIPHKELARMGEIFSVGPDAPTEIKTLYEKVCKKEFKYTAFRQAYRNTGLEVYDKYLRQKMHDIGQLNIQVYFSVFPNPTDNAQRLYRLYEEANNIVLIWAQQNQQDALDKSLNIVVDHQVFPERMRLDAYIRRGKFNTWLIPKSKCAPAIEKGTLRKIATDKNNSIDIVPVNSQTYTRVQLSDMIVGCIRERYVTGSEEYLSFLHPLLNKARSRVKIEDYSPPDVRRVEI